MADKPPPQPQPQQHFAVCDPRALPHATDIDRRTCVRTVPMQVLAFGLGRTGTSSLRSALISLGYYDVYHYSAALQENPRDAEMWNEALAWKYGNPQTKQSVRPFTKKDWNQLLGHCMAVTDAPCNLFAAELLEAYPDAKVILTTRDTPEQWWKSVNESLLPFTRYWEDTTSLSARFLKAFGPQHPPALSTFVDWCAEIYLRPWYDEDDAKRLYAEHNERIRALVPRERLLEFNVKQGWEPLCRFLGKDVPDSPFPRVNDKEQWDRFAGENARIVRRVAVSNFLKTVGVPLLAVLVAGVGMFVRWT